TLLGWAWDYFDGYYGPVVPRTTKTTGRRGDLAVDPGRGRTIRACIGSRSTTRSDGSTATAPRSPFGRPRGSSLSFPYCSGGSSSLSTCSLCKSVAFYPVL